MSVSCLHLLVKHKDSRRPSSWKEERVTRSKEEAVALIKEYQKQLGPSPTKEQFSRLATTESHCSSAKDGGDLGSFGRGQMQKPFEDAAFALPVNSVSGIVTTDSGIHLIYRYA